MIKWLDKWFSSIFFCYYMFRDENLLINFLLRKWYFASKKMYTGFMYLVWIYAYGININQTIICLSHWHTTQSGVILKCGSVILKCGFAICEFGSGKSVNYKANNLRVASRPICKLLYVSWRICEVRVVSVCQSAPYLSPQMRQSKSNNGM